MLKDGYTFEKYPFAFPYKEVDDGKTDVTVNEARALRATQVSQNHSGNTRAI